MATKKAKSADAGEGAAAALPASVPKGADLIAEVADACAGLMVEVIDTPMMYELAAAELVDLQAKYKEIEDKRFGITRPMDAAKKAVMELFKSPLETLETKIKALKAGMLTYEQEERRKAAAQQALLDRVAQQQKQALEAEAARAAEEARIQSARAAELIAAGDSEGANAALDAAEQSQEMAAAFGKTSMVVSAAAADINVPTVAGLASADIWKARVTDMGALLRFIADHPEYHDWVDLKMTGLHDMAKSQRDAMRIPGVEPFEDKIITARSGYKRAA